MKALASFAVLIFCAVAASGAKADFVHCSNFVQTSPKLKRALAFLQSVQGTYQLGDCAIELHVCESFAADDQPGSVVGDLLIRNSRGHERYVQIEFAEKSSSGLSVSEQNGSMMFHYEFNDTNRTKEFGNRESVRLEFLKSVDRKSLVSIEEGWYGAKDSESRRRKVEGGSVYRWLLCHGETPLRSVPLTFE